METNTKEKNSDSNPKEKTKIKEKNPNDQLVDFGKLLIKLGIAGFAIAVIQSFTIWSGLDQGALPAGSFFSIMLGMAFCFPSMLEESKGELSTMRIIVYAVVMLFCVIYLKIGWNIGNFEQFTIDKTWIYILGLAFGSKVFQRFAEDDNKSGNE